MITRQAITNRLRGLLHRDKKVKPIKKNTLRRRVKAWFMCLDRRQQQREIVPEMVDDTRRKCSNCGHVYTGRVCPQCSQAGTWERYTWRQAFLNFLDIWGLGNRPMFRTLRELFIRPGYMSRDYLLGHRQFYFPPFKLLAIAVVLMIFVGWLTGIKVDSTFFELLCNTISRSESHFKPPLSLLVHAGSVFFNFLSNHLLYEWLFIGVNGVICVWIAFRGVSRYNLVETYIFLIFVSSQMVLLQIPEIICTGIDTYVRSSFFVSSLAPSPSMTLIQSVYDTLANLVSSVFNLMCALLFVMDFKQFYGLTWKKTIGRMLASFLVAAGIIVAGIVVAVMLWASAQGNNIGQYVLYTGYWFALLVAGFLIAVHVFKKYRPQVNKTVIRLCKASMLSVFAVPTFGMSLIFMGVHPVINSIVVILLSALLVALSLSPIYLYKKFGSTWIATIPLALLTIMFVLTQLLL